MRLIHVLVMFALLMLVGCGGGGGGGATAPNDFTIPASMSLSADNVSLAPGTATMTSTMGHYTGASDQDLTASVVLSSTNPSIADPVGGGSLILAGAPGTAVITATWTGIYGDQVTTNLTVTVKDVSVVAVHVTPVAPGTGTVIEGGTTSFAASADFDDFSSQDLLNAVVTWSSDDDTLATVNTSGTATGVKAGDVNINAEFGGLIGSAVLTVEPVLVGIELSASPAHISQNESTQFTVSGVYSDGSVSGDFTESSVFSLEPGPITAVISNQSGSKGLLTGVNADGNLLVTATYGGFTDTFNLAIFTP